LVDESDFDSKSSSNNGKKKIYSIF